MKPLIATFASFSCLATAHAGTTLIAGKGPVPAQNVSTAAPASNPLSFAGGKIVFGVENQTRFEYRGNNFDFNDSVDGPQDDSWLLNRFRISLGLKPVEGLMLYFQGQDSREIDSDRPNIPNQLGAEGDNPFDLRQAWLEIGDNAKGVSLKAGRQVMLYGDQRLIGPLDWSNLSRTFDAVKLRYATSDGMWVDTFVSSVVTPDRNGFDESDWDNTLSGIYAHLPKTGPQDTELYVLYSSNDVKSDDFFTLGTRFKSTPGALGAWDYEAEVAYQTGTAGGRDLSAFASYVEAGYTFDAPWKPRLGLEYSFGSGDDNAKDGENGAFQNLYPTNHLHYGYMDVHSWSNLHNVALHLSAKPAEKLTASVGYHLFWLDTTEDTWRRANAVTAVRPLDEKSRSASNFAGSELDLLVTWVASPNLTLTAGYSHYFAGDYLSDTGADSDADFVYLMAGFKF